MKNHSIVVRSFARLIAFILCCCLLGCENVAFANTKDSVFTDQLGRWVPSPCQEDAFNMGGAAMRTEYPVYRTGVGSLYLQITNKGKIAALGYGVEYWLERKADNKWYRYVQPERTEDGAYIVWPSFGYVLEPGGSMGHRLAFWAGALPDGEYRIIKAIDDEEGNAGTRYLYSAPFTVAPEGYHPARLSGYRPLQELPKDYTVELARESGDVVLPHSSEMENGERFAEFIEKVAQGIPAKLRITDFRQGTAEVQDITYDSRCFTYEKDASRKTGKSELEKMVFAYLRGHGAQGKKQVVLADHPEGRLGRLVIIHDHATGLGKRAMAALQQLEKQGGSYQVFAPDASKALVWMDSLGPAYIGWNYFGPSDVNGSSMDFQDQQGTLQALIRMDWLDDKRAQLVFQSRMGRQCLITFDVGSKTVLQRQYQ